MNKKLVILLAIVILLIIGGVVFAFVNINQTQNKEPQDLGGTTENNNQNTQTNQIVSEEGNTNSNVALNQNSAEGEKEETMNNQKKALVLYFSQSGNTEKVANFIHEEIDSDIIKLETVKTYNSNYNDLIDEAQEEQRQNARPELKTEINIDEYDTIFLGYPNWWGDMPMPIYTFLEEYDLSGKTIAPFITHGGSGLSGTPNKIKNEEPNAEVTEGLAINGSSAGNSKSTVQSWISRIEIQSN